MNKIAIFQNTYETLISYNLIYQDPNIYFIVDGNDLYLTMKGQENRIKKYIYSLHQDEKKQHIDKRTAKKLLEEFIQLCPHHVIELETIAKLEEEDRQLEIEEADKDRLSDIIPYIQKFNKFNNNIEVRFFAGMKKYAIEFTCKQSMLLTDTITIYNTHNAKKQYLLKVNTATEELSKEELLNKLEILYTNYLPHFNELQEKLKVEAEKQNEQTQLANKVFNIRSNLASNKQVIFKTGKDKFTIFVDDIKYSVGKGYSGKFMYYSYATLEKIVKSNKGYFIADKEQDFTSEELKELNFITV